MTVVASRSCSAGRPPRVGFAVLFALVFAACGSGGGGSGGGGGGGGGGAGAAIYNGSFEVLGGNADGQQPDGWVREGVDGSFGFGVKRKTSSGFMPTDGQFFTEFPSTANGSGSPFVPNYPTLVMYQDDVDLSAATSLVFDYETTNISIQAGSGPLGHDASAKVRIYFQPNSGGGGTVDLWVQSYGPGAVPEQVLDQSVPLPTLAVPGRLAIEVTTTLASSIVIGPASLTFRLDSLAAQ
jgi:hypothetical protein